MWKEKTKEKKKVKVLKKDGERELKFKEDLDSFKESFKLYIAQNTKLLRAIFEKVYEKGAEMLMEELGEERADYKKRTRTFLLSLVFCVAVFLISSASFLDGIFPLSLALISSGGTLVKKRASFEPRIIVGLTFFSVILSTLNMGEDGLIYFTAVFTVFVMRSVVTRGEFNESLTFRTLSSFFASVVVGLCVMIIGSFGIDSVFQGVGLCVITPVFAYMFSGFFVSLGDKIVDSRLKARAEVGIAAAFFALVLALSKFGILGFSLSATLSFFVTVIVAKTLGSMHAGVFGMLGGIASGGGLFSAVFGVVGVVSAVFFTVSDVMALSVGVFISSAVSIYIGGFDALITTLPEVLFACLVSYPVLKLAPLSKEKIELIQDRLSSPSNFEMEEVEKKLKKMSNTFSSLSEVFFAVTDTLKTPSREDVRNTVDNACNKVCATCSMSGMCWSKYYSDSLETKNIVAEKILSSARVTKEDFPDFFVSRCTKLDTICDHINRRYSAMCYNLNDATRANLIAEEYRTVSKLLQNTAEETKSEREDNLTLARRAARAMKSLVLPFGRIEARGNRKSVIDVMGVSPEKMDKSSADILAAFETECEMLFEEPEFIELESTSVLRLKRRCAITLECAKKSVGKKGEKVNGDSLTFFEKDSGLFYALLCDGMGSGRSAALTSRLASVFLEKILTCTDDKKVTLEMLNSLIMAKKEECFTTLDLVEIDLFEKKASFIKAGAAPSFVVRENEIYKINSATPPAGIISKITAEETKISLKDGDRIVLFSDGIIDSEEWEEDEGAWLVSLLDENSSKSAEEVSSAILNEALSRFLARDDMSVAVIEVHEI